MIISNHRWGRKAHHWGSDDRKAHHQNQNLGEQRLSGILEISGSLAHRIQCFLLKTCNLALDPLDYMKRECMRLAMMHLAAHLSAHVLRRGDLKKTVERLRLWLHVGVWTSLPHDLSHRVPAFKTFWKSCRAITSLETDTSWIKHILLHPLALPSVTLIKMKLSLGLYWITCTDHRPVVLAIEGEVFDPLQVWSLDCCSWGMDW